MQQPFAAAMVAGVGLFSRRGRATRFGDIGKNSAKERTFGPTDGSEWIAIHCGQNNEHLRNKPLMKRVREFWPDCPPDEELISAQKCLLGVALFVDGAVPGPVASKQCAILREYPCSKPVAWRAATARALAAPAPYPKGQVQVWHVYKEGFTSSSADSKKVLALTKGALKNLKNFDVKAEKPIKKEVTKRKAGSKAASKSVKSGNGSATKRQRTRRRVKKE